MKSVIQVVEYKTKEVVEEIDVTGRSVRSIDRIDDGININLNHEEYFTRINHVKKVTP